MRQGSLIFRWDCNFATIRKSKFVIWDICNIWGLYMDCPIWGLSHYHPSSYYNWFWTPKWRCLVQKIFLIGWFWGCSPSWKLFYLGIRIITWVLWYEKSWNLPCPLLFFFLASLVSKALHFINSGYDFPDPRFSTPSSLKSEDSFMGMLGTNAGH